MCVFKKRMNYHGMTACNLTSRIRTNEPRIIIALSYFYDSNVFLFIGALFAYTCTYRHIYTRVQFINAGC